MNIYTIYIHILVYIYSVLKAVEFRVDKLGQAMSIACIAIPQTRPHFFEMPLYRVYLFFTLTWGRSLKGHPWPAWYDDVILFVANNFLIVT